MTAAGGLAFAAAVRVIHRVHGDAAVGGANALPAIASRLADRHILVIGIAHLADGRHALHQHLAGLAGRQLQKRVVAFLSNQLRLRAGRTRHLRALARPKLDRMHRGAGRNILERQRIADQDVGIRTRAHRSLRPSGPPAAGCSASRRRRSAPERCAPSGSDRTRSSPLCPERRTSRA